MRKLRFICEGELLADKFNGGIYQSVKFYILNQRLVVTIEYRHGHYNYDSSIFKHAKIVLTNNKLNRKLYEGKYVIREGYLTVDIDEV